MGRVWGVMFVMFPLATLQDSAFVEKQYFVILQLLCTRLAVPLHFLLSWRPVGCEMGRNRSVRCRRGGGAVNKKGNIK